MNAIRYAVFAVCLAGTLALATTHPPLPATDHSADEAAIRKIDVAWSHAAETKDLDGLMAPYATDGSILPFNAPIATGTAAIRKVWAALIAEPGYALHFASTKIEIAASGDMAYDLGTFELKLNDAQGNPMIIPGKFVITWKKIDGTWKVVADIFNTDK
jgi:ketosteroid isomerase-like protein